MKISLLAAIGVVGVFSASSLHAQQEVTRTKTAQKTRTTSTTTTSGFRYRPRTQPSAPVAATPTTDGVVPRAIRSGSPLQMINPFAPAAYGNGNDTVRHEPSDPYARPQGIKLVAVDF